MGIKISKNDILWNYLGTFMTLGSNIMLLPFLIFFLDSDSIGLWYVFLSVGGVVTLFDFGFNPTLARNVAYCWSGASELNKTGVTFTTNNQPNIALLKRVISTCKKVYFIISLLALLVMVTIGTAYIIHVSNDINGDSHLIAWFIFCFAVFINLYYGYYSTLLRGVGAISQFNIANIISRLLQLILSLTLLLLGMKIIAVALAYLLNGLVFRLLARVFFLKYENIEELINEEKLNVTKNDIKETFNLIWHNAWRDGLVSVSIYLSSQASIIICSLYLSLTETGIYSISIQLVTAIATLSGALYNSYQPSLQSAYINNDTDLSKKIMSVSITVYALLFLVSTLLLVAIGIPILSLIREDLNLDIPVFIGIAIYTFLLKHHSIHTSYISSTNNVIYMKAYLITSLFSVVLSVLAIKYTGQGIWALVVTQALVQLAYNNWKWPKVVLKELCIKPQEIFVIGMREVSGKISPIIKFKKRNIPH